MKRIFTIIAIAMGLMMPMQAQQAITKELKAGKNVEHKMMRKAPAANIIVDDILGTYEASAPSAFQGQPTQEWTVNITVDSKDANKVWIHPICLFEGATADIINPVYATFDPNKGTLTMPLGQVLYEEPGQGKLVTGASEDGQKIDTTGDVVMSISKSTRGVIISFAEQYFFGIGDILNNAWWYQAVYGVTFTQEFAIPSVYIYLNGMDTPVEVPAAQLYFTEVEGEMHVSNVAEYTEGGIEGTYNAYAESAFDGYPDESWTVNITADATESNKYWISPIFMFGGLAAEEINPVYAYYNEANGTLTMPLGQILYEVASYNYRFIVGASNDGQNIDTTGDFVMTVEDNFITFPEGYMIGAGNTLEEEGWWYQGLMNTTYSMDATFAYPVANIERITREKPEVNADYTHFLPGTYNWAFDVQVSETETQTITTSTEFAVDEVFDLSEVYGKEAAGEMGIDWTVTGFLGEAGLFIDEVPTMGALSYVITQDGTTYDILSFADKDSDRDYLYSCAGTTIMYDQQGNEIYIDLFLGDATSGGQINMVSFAAVSETEIYYNGERPVLWYLYDGSAYLYTDMGNLAFEPATDNAPMRMKATLGEKATIVGQGTRLNLNPTLRK